MGIACTHQVIGKAFQVFLVSLAMFRHFVFYRVYPMITMAVYVVSRIPLEVTGDPWFYLFLKLIFEDLTVLT